MGCLSSKSKKTHYQYPLPRTPVNTTQQTSHYHDKQPSAPAATKQPAHSEVPPYRSPPAPQRQVSQPTVVRRSPPPRTPIAEVHPNTLPSPQPLSTIVVRRSSPPVIVPTKPVAPIADVKPSSSPPQRAIIVRRSPPSEPAKPKVSKNTPPPVIVMGQTRTRHRRHRHRAPTKAQPKEKPQPSTIAPDNQQRTLVKRRDKKPSRRHQNKVVVEPKIQQDQPTQKQTKHRHRGRQQQANKTTVEPQTKVLQLPSAPSPKIKQQPVEVKQNQTASPTQKRIPRRHQVRKMQNPQTAGTILSFQELLNKFNATMAEVNYTNANAVRRNERCVVLHSEQPKEKPSTVRLSPQLRETLTEKRVEPESEPIVVTEVNCSQEAFESHEELVKTTAEYIAVTRALASARGVLPPQDKQMLPELNLNHLAAFRSARSAGPLYIAVPGRRDDESLWGDMRTQYTAATSRQDSTSVMRVADDLYVAFENGSTAESTQFELPDDFYEQAESIVSELRKQDTASRHSPVRACTDDPVPFISIPRARPSAMLPVPMQKPVITATPPAQYNFDAIDSTDDSEVGCRPSDIFRLADAEMTEDNRISFGAADARVSTLVVFNSPPPRASRVLATLAELSEFEDAETSRPIARDTEGPSRFTSTDTNKATQNVKEGRPSFALSTADTAWETPCFVLEESTDSNDSSYTTTTSTTSTSQSSSISRGLVATFQPPQHPQQQELGINESVPRRCRQPAVSFDSPSPIRQRQYQPLVGHEPLGSTLTQGARRPTEPISNTIAGYGENDAQISPHAEREWERQGIIANPMEGDNAAFATAWRPRPIIMNSGNNRLVPLAKGTHYDPFAPGADKWIATRMTNAGGRVPVPTTEEMNSESPLKGQSYNYSNISVTHGKQNMNSYPHHDDINDWRRA